MAFPFNSINTIFVGHNLKEDMGDEELLSKNLEVAQLIINPIKQRQCPLMPANVGRLKLLLYRNEIPTKNQELLLLKLIKQKFKIIKATP